MDGCIMCENTLTLAASQKMLRLLEEVFHVDIVSTVEQTLFVCNRCEVNVRFIEGAMQLKNEMQEHLFETLDILRSSVGVALTQNSQAKRARVLDDDNVRFLDPPPSLRRCEMNASEPLNQKRPLTGDILNHDRENTEHVPASSNQKSLQSSNIISSFHMQPNRRHASDNDDSRHNSYVNVNHGVSAERVDAENRSRQPSAGVNLTTHSDARHAATSTQGNQRQGMIEATQRHWNEVTISSTPKLLPSGRDHRDVSVSKKARAPAAVPLRFAASWTDSSQGYGCSWCGKVLATQAWLTRHEKSCVGAAAEGAHADSANEVDTSSGQAAPEAWACEHCGKAFKKKTWLLKHALICSPDGGPLANGSSPGPPIAPLTCGKCGKRYSTRYDKYREHIESCQATSPLHSLMTSRTATPSVPRAFGELAANKDTPATETAANSGLSEAEIVHTCPTCGRTYTKRYDYFVRHVRACKRKSGACGGDDIRLIPHPESAAAFGNGDQSITEARVCPKCSKTYRRQEDLWQHMEMCRGVPGRNVGPHVCDKCGKSYTTRYDVLAKHVLECTGSLLTPNSNVQDSATVQNYSVPRTASDQDQQRTGSMDMTPNTSFLKESRPPKDMTPNTTFLKESRPSKNVDNLPLASHPYSGSARHSGRAFPQGPHTCHKCSRQYTARYDCFLKHVRKCRGIEDLTVRDGGRNDTELDSSLASSQSHTCNKCGREYTKRYDMYIKHMETCTGLENDSSTDNGGNSSKLCTSCGQIFSGNYEDFTLHTQHCQGPAEDVARQEGLEGNDTMLSDAVTVMQGKANSMCPKCGKSYVQLGSLRKHVALCTGGSVRANPSPFVLHAWADRESNNSDEEIELGQRFQQARTCSKCGQMFDYAHFDSHVQHCAAASDMDAHLSSGSDDGIPNSLHTVNGDATATPAAQSNLWICGHCSKEFQQKGLYIRHISSCSMEYLKCQKCDFARYYSNKRDFENHTAACRGKSSFPSVQMGSACNVASEVVPTSAEQTQFALTSQQQRLQTAVRIGATDMNACDTDVPEMLDTFDNPPDFAIDEVIPMSSE